MSEDTIVWNLRGISDEARAHARAEAEAAGVPIGEWLSVRIREAAEGGSRTSAARQASSPAGASEPGNDEIEARIDEVLLRAERVTREQIEDLRGSIEHLAQRIERLENARNTAG